MHSERLQSRQVTGAIPVGNEFHFSNFTLDLARASLRLQDRELNLRPKSFEVLRYLVENADRLVTKNEIIDAVWPNVFVTDDSLKKCVSEVRRVLGDGAQHLIRTVPRRGYMFAARVVRETDNRPSCGLAPGAPTTPFETRPTTALRALAERPSIAVLPFQNLSDDPQQEYFADGIAEDLTTSLAQFNELMVSARNSAFRYKHRRVDVRQLARELGVRYLLEGSIRRRADRVRIVAQLIDAESGNHLWAEHYDRDLSGIFEFQDEVTRRIAVALVAHVKKSEIDRAMRKPPENLAAYDCCLRANALFRNLQPDTIGAATLGARALFEQSLSSDPGYAPALIGLAETYLRSWFEPISHPGLAREFQRAATVDRALSLAQRAVEADDRLAQGFATLGWILHWLHRRSESMVEFARAFELNTNFSERAYRYGVAHVLNGQTAEGIEFLERLMRLDPFPSAFYRSCLGCGYFFAERYPEALESLRLAVRRIPGYRTVCVWHAAAAGQLGETEEASRSLAQARQLEPDLTIRKWLRFVGLGKAEDSDRLARALRKAGLPQ